MADDTLSEGEELPVSQVAKKSPRPAKASGDELSEAYSFPPSEKVPEIVP